MAAVITFVAGLLGTAVFLAAARPDQDGVAWAIHRWDRNVTTPATLLVWAFGLTLALMGGWFRAGWLLAKLVLVVLLSGIHGMHSAKPRRLAGNVATTAALRPMAPLIVGAIMVIAILVVVKPF